MKLKVEKQGFLSEDMEAHLEDWLNGISRHNEIRKECAPDASCCHPDLEISLEEKQAFIQAYFDSRKGYQAAKDFQELRMKYMARAIRRAREKKGT